VSSQLQAAKLAPDLMKGVTSLARTIIEASLLRLTFSSPSTARHSPLDERSTEDGKR
jgi:hypothetical protein